MHRSALALLLLVACAPLATPPAEAACYPAADDTATAIGVGDATFYHKTWGRTTRYHEIWEETNGIPGLQLDSGMACGSFRDTLRSSACIGTGGCVFSG